MKLRKYWIVPGIPIAVTALLWACVIIKVYRNDSYVPTSKTEFDLPNAKAIIGMALPSDIAEDSWHLRWDRPDGCPSLWVFAFDPSYDTCRINSMSMLIDETNRLAISFADNDNDFDGRDQHFVQYEDEYAFTNQYPGIKPRYVTYYPVWADIPTNALAAGASVRVDLGMEIFAHGQIICQTNLSASFVMDRKERRRNLFDVLLSLLMPRF